MRIKQPDQTRETLLDAAFWEIYRHGFQAASLSNILHKTGLTKGALYHHFPAKHDLGLAVVDEVIHQRLEKWLFLPLRNATDPITTLREILRNRAKLTTPEMVALGCPLNNLMQEMSPLDKEFKQHLSVVLKIWQDTVFNALKRAQQNRQLRQNIDCRAAALFIISAFEGCISVSKNLQSPKEFRLCMTQLDDYLEHLLVKVSA
ncbi:MAG: TetR/AcrR family transcriptional regulator [Gammaproteobacteria bacterium]|nr:TetR/AcrR family transcriptional regulator [Gammaproteobacteria bacterium]